MTDEYIFKFSGQTQIERLSSELKFIWGEPSVWSISPAKPVPDYVLCKKKKLVTVCLQSLWLFVRRE